MSTEPTPYVRALAEEYRRCQQAEAAQILDDITADLAHHGWSIGESGELARIQERAVTDPAPETPEKPAPRGKAAPKE